MNWNKALLAGVAGGVVFWLYDFVMHGLIMAPTYAGHPAFAQEQASPFWFLLVEVCTGIAGALVFARTRSTWGAGIKGGVTFGFFLGLTAFFPNFINPLVINEFPYYLAWCWGGIVLIGWMVFGGVAGLIYRETA